MKITRYKGEMAVSMHEIFFKRQALSDDGFLSWRRRLRCFGDTFHYLAVKTPLSCDALADVRYHKRAAPLSRAVVY